MDPTSPNRRNRAPRISNVLFYIRAGPRFDEFLILVPVLNMVEKGKYTKMPVDEFVVGMCQAIETSSVPRYHS